MPRKKSEAELVEELEKTKAEVLAKLDAAKKRLGEKQRKDDTKRKIIYGSLLLNMMESGEIDKNKINQKLDEFLTRDIDRKFMGLPTKIKTLPEQNGDKE